MYNKKIKVAIIDSGIELKNEYLKDNIYDGVRFYIEDSYVCMDKEFNDTDSHGTLCAVTIKNLCKNSFFYVVKITDEKGFSNNILLEEDLRYLLDIDIDIINMSIGLESGIRTSEIKNLCYLLDKQNKLLISSVHSHNKNSVPASLNSVIGVDCAVLENKDTYLYNRNYNVNIICDSYPHLTLGLNGEYVMFGGSSSHSCAFITGKIAKYLSMGGNKANVHDFLERYSKLKEWDLRDYNISHRFIENKTGVEVNNIIFDSVSSILNKYKVLYDEEWYIMLDRIDNNVFFSIIRDINNSLCLNIDYGRVKLSDFFSLYNLFNLIVLNSK